MNFNNTKNWAFTLQIPSFKKVKYAGNQLAYKSLDFDAQKAFLKLCIDIPVERFDGENHIEYEIYYEKHADGRLHAHGTFYNLTIDQIKCIQTIVCRDAVGISTLKQFDHVFNFLPIFNSIGWEKYSTKEVEPTDDDRFKEYGF